MIFLLDLSGSLKQEDMKYPLNYIKKVIREMDVSPESSRIALITFSDTSHVQFTFDSYTNKYDVMHALDLVGYLGKGTKLAPALELARAITLNQGRSSYEGFYHYFVVITDDLPSDLEASMKVSEVFYSFASVMSYQIKRYISSRFFFIFAGWLCTK